MPSNQDVAVVRELAAQTAEIAALPVQDSPGRTFTAAGGQPVGTTYAWSVQQGGDLVEITQGANTDTVTVEGRAPSALNFVLLKLTYTHGGAQGFWLRGLTVHKPTRPNSTRVIGGMVQNPGPPDWECHRVVTYTALSQHNYVFVNMLWDETVWALPDDPGWPINQGDGHTDANGQVEDHLGWTQQHAWHQPRHMVRHLGQTIRLGGWHSETTPFWLDRIGMYDDVPPDVIVNPTD